MGMSRLRCHGYVKAMMSWAMMSWMCQGYDVKVNDIINNLKSYYWTNYPQWSYLTGATMEGFSW